MSKIPADYSRLEHELQQTRQQVDMLLYTLSHDLRTPAMTALGFADLLASEVTHLSPSAQQYLEHIRASTNRQVTMIEQLIELTGLLRAPMHIENIDLSQLCTEVMNEVQAKTRASAHIDLQATPLIRGDRAMLKKLLHNLIDNAVKFTRRCAQPQITFTAQAQNDATWYSLTDNGVGFDPENAGRLFQPFRRLHPSKQFSGIGMGLATAALIVQRHHGQIVAEGEPDKGATIRFRLAAKDDTPALIETRNS
jgi:signal transduction histidine kinase